MADRSSRRPPSRVESEVDRLIASYGDSPYTLEDDEPPQSRTTGHDETIRTKPPSLRIINRTPHAEAIRRRKAIGTASGSPRQTEAMRRRRTGPAEPPGDQTLPGPTNTAERTSSQRRTTPSASQSSSRESDQSFSRPSAWKRSAKRVALSTSSDSRSSKSRKSSGHSSELPFDPILSLTGREVFTEVEIKARLLPVVILLTRGSSHSRTPAENMHISRLARAVLQYALDDDACPGGIGRACFYVGYTLYNSRDPRKAQRAMAYFRRALDAEQQRYVEADWARQFLNRWKSSNSRVVTADGPPRSLPSSGSWIMDSVREHWHLHWARGREGDADWTRPGSRNGPLEDYAPTTVSTLPSVKESEKPEPHTKWPPSNTSDKASVPSRVSNEFQKLLDLNGLEWSPSRPDGKSEASPGVRFCFTPTESPQQRRDVRDPGRASDDEGYNYDDDEEQEYLNNLLDGNVRGRPPSPPDSPAITHPPVPPTPPTVTPDRRALRYYPTESEAAAGRQECYENYWAHPWHQPHDQHPALMHRKRFMPRHRELYKTTWRGGPETLPMAPQLRADGELREPNDPFVDRSDRSIPDIHPGNQQFDLLHVADQPPPMYQREQEPDNLSPVYRNRPVYLTNSAEAFLDSGLPNSGRAFASGIPSRSSSAVFQTARQTPRTRTSASRSTRQSSSYDPRFARPTSTLAATAAIPLPKSAQSPPDSADADLSPTSAESARNRWHMSPSHVLVNSIGLGTRRPESGRLLRGAEEGNSPHRPSEAEGLYQMR